MKKLIIVFLVLISTSAFARQTSYACSDEKDSNDSQMQLMISSYGTITLTPSQTRGARVTWGNYSSVSNDDNETEYRGSISRAPFYVLRSSVIKISKNLLNRQLAAKFTLDGENYSCLMMLRL